MTTINKYKKKDGKTYFQFKHYVKTTPDGKKHYVQRRGFETEKEANIALSKLIIEIEEHGYRKQSIDTFEKKYIQWLENVHKNRVRSTTASRTEDMFRLHILPVFGDKKISKITPQMCQEQVVAWREYYQKFKALKAYSQNVFSYAILLGLIKDNPMNAVIMPKKKESLDLPMNERKNFYSATQLKQFLSIIEKETPLIYTMFYVLAYTGLRKGELLALNWSDIDFTNKALTISKNLTNVRKESILSLPKNHYSLRTIDLDDDTLLVLTKWRIEQAKLYSQFEVKTSATKDCPIFTRVDYHGVIQRCYLDFPNNFSRNFFKHHPEIKKISPHGFRHTHVTLLFESGASIKEVQERVGRSPNDLSVTVGIYQHVTKKKQTEAIDRLANYIKDEKTNAKKDTSHQ